MKAEEFPVVLFSSQDGDVRVNAVLRDRTSSLACFARYMESSSAPAVLIASGLLVTFCAGCCGEFLDMINKIDRIMGNVGNVLNSVNPVNPV